MTMATPRRQARAVALAALAVTLLGAALAQSADLRRWLPLAKDGVHDPTGPAVTLLQEPREALATLAPDTAGNQVRWMEALAKGQIQPRGRVTPDPLAKDLELRETEIFLNLKGGTPIVRFPHKQHTLWLSCGNCHDDLFKREVGATKLDMRGILQGEQCGLCHGAVSFPLTECNRCHNTSREGFVPPPSQAGGTRTGAALVPGKGP